MGERQVKDAGVVYSKWEKAENQLIRKQMEEKTLKRPPIQHPRTFGSIYAFHFQVLNQKKVSHSSNSVCFYNFNRHNGFKFNQTYYISDAARRLDSAPITAPVTSINHM